VSLSLGAQLRIKVWLPDHHAAVHQDAERRLENQSKERK
jgi:hypothetical protein